MSINTIVIRLFFGAAAILILFTLALPPLSPQANLPPRHTPNLPPRYTPAPNRDSGADDGLRNPAGAYIELHVRGQTSLWTVVQWQGNDGRWHDVEGWRGDLEADGIRRWWVAAKDFDTGPFRWAIYQSQNGPKLATSPPFHLPDQANEVLRIGISIEP